MGWNACRKAYSFEAQALALGVIDRARATVHMDGEMMAGKRWFNDREVLARMESAFCEEEFKAAPLACATQALEDAARSDYWYEIEKEWASDE